jgi:hypothetical protein
MDILMGVFTTVNVMIHVPMRGSAVTAPHNKLWGCSNHIYKDSSNTDLNRIFASGKAYVQEADLNPRKAPSNPRKAPSGQYPTK